MMQTPLQHLTINTGHLRASHRAEVAGDVIDRLLPLIDSGLGPLPGTSMDFRLLHRVPGGAAWQIEEHGEKMRPYVIGIQCWMREAVAGGWSSVASMATGMHLAVPAQPILPWLAVCLYPWYLGLPHDDIAMLGDAERCIAWTLIESEAAR